ncbi:MAG: PepSY domain-containing protein [Thioalkalivibrionaceae bacterium]
MALLLTVAAFESVWAQSPSADEAVREALKQVPGQVLSVRPVDLGSSSDSTYKIRILTEQGHVRTVRVPSSGAPESDTASPSNSNSSGDASSSTQPEQREIGQAGRTPEPRSEAGDASRGFDVVPIGGAWNGR